MQNSKNVHLRVVVVTFFRPHTNHIRKLFTSDLKLKSPSHDQLLSLLPACYRQLFLFEKTLVHDALKQFFLHILENLFVKIVILPLLGRVKLLLNGKKPEAVQLLCGKYNNHEHTPCGICNYALTLIQGFTCEKILSSFSHNTVNLPSATEWGRRFHQEFGFLGTQS